MLAVEVEFLSGVSYAADAAKRAEWPPHGDRLFSAFVAAWGEGGCDETERAALEWLESLAPPDLVASEAHTRASLTSYVPRNDEVSLPEHRGRKDRVFPAVVPETPTIHFIWQTASPSDVIVNAMRTMASRLSYLGHSASLVRARVVTEEVQVASDRTTYRPGDGDDVFRWVYAGRLDALERGFTAARKNGRTWRPSQGVAYRYTSDRIAPPPIETIFGAEWVIWELKSD